MGLFKRKKKKNEEEQIESIYRWMTVEEALAYSRGELAIHADMIEKMTAEVCSQIIEFRELQEETKLEYGVVSDYLSDIQRIEQLSEKDRAGVTDAARMIVNLDDERVRYQNSDRRIPMEQHRTFTMYEQEMPYIIEDLKKKEEYLELVKSDMRQIEGERGVIKYEREHAEDKREFLKKLSYGIIFGVIILFIGLILFSNYARVDLAVPFFMTGIGAMAFMFYYLIQIGRCATQIRKSDARMNRATVLMNKIKIKYVNTVNALEYAFEKYQVEDLYELENSWAEFVKMRDEERRYRKNTQLLNAYQNNLTDYLNKLGMKKTEAWVHQPDVFISRGDMLDFKDAIDHRRRKLRAQIDFNNRQQDNSLKEIDNLKEKYPEYTDVITNTVKKLGILNDGE